jgi:hypothetical protein
MAEETPVWNLDPDQWNTLVKQAQSTADALEDGAYVRVESRMDSGTPELWFYATATNAPPGWRFPFLEDIPKSRAKGASVGRAWHEAPTGFVQFDVEIPAAAQALSADYESGVSDLDYVTYEQAVEQAVRGTPADLLWLTGEFARLVSLSAL